MNEQKVVPMTAEDMKRAYLKEWRNKNRDRVREYGRKWRAEHKDYMREKRNEYWQRKADEYNRINRLK